MSGLARSARRPSEGGALPLLGEVREQLGGIERAGQLLGRGSPLTPETRYAVRGDAHVAYQVIGGGGLSLVSVSTWFSHLEARWELPGFAHYLDRLSSFARVVSFDKYGIGLSDPIPSPVVPPLEEWVDDVRVVMDAAGIERAAILGAGEGAMMAALFAATHPERTTALVVVNGTARLGATGGYSIGIGDDERDRIVALLARTWGQADGMVALNPSIAGDAAVCAAWAHYMRLAASPGTAASVTRTLFDFDVRALLSTIRVPTLVVHRRHAPLPPVEQGRYLAEQIPDARFVEVAGRDYSVVVGDVDAVLDPVEEFLTGGLAGATRDRALATLLFADIVGSTERLAELGDRRWRELMQAHDSVVRRQLTRHGGTLVDTAGDGVFATFGGAARAVACAVALREAVRALGLTLRVGIHVGEVERAPTPARPAGLAVHIANRIQATAQPGQILVSRTVRDLAVGAPLQFRDCGSHLLKGVPEQWQLYSVEA